MLFIKSLAKASLLFRPLNSQQTTLFNSTVFFTQHRNVVLAQKDFKESTPKVLREKFNKRSPKDEGSCILGGGAKLVASLETDKEVAAFYNQGTPKIDEKFLERVVQIRRVTKVVKGGKQLSFRAVVVIGHKRGQVGVGVASAKEVIGAVTKAVADAKRNLISFDPTRYQSIPHRTEGRSGASRVILLPACEGTGVVAGGATRVVLELAGFRNIFGKQLGADNPLNNARATIEGLRALCSFQQMAKERGTTIDKILGKNILIH